MPLAVGRSRGSDRRERHRGQRHEHEPHAESLDEAWPEDRPEVRAEAQRAHEEERVRDDGHPDRDEPPRVDPVDQAAADGEGDERPDPARRQHPARGEGVVAQEMLRVEGEEHEAPVEPEADQRHQERAERERSVREHAQVDDGIGHRQLPPDEGHEGDHSEDDEPGDGGRVEPVESLALVQRDLEGADARHEEGEADAVERAGGPAAGLRALRRVLQEGAAERQRDRAERQVQVEDPPPGVVVGDPAAHRRPHDGRDHDAETPDGHGHPALSRGKDLHEDGLRERDERAPAEPLEDPRPDEELEARGRLPESSELTMNVTVAIRKKRRRPSRATSQPVAGRITALAARNDVRTQVISSSEAERLPCMWGSATLVTLVSRTCIDATSMTAMVTSQRRAAGSAMRKPRDPGPEATGRRS